LDFLRQSCRAVCHGDWLAREWFVRFASGLDKLLAEESALIAALEEQHGSLYDKASYGV
jgi:hypothetical protein